MLAQIDPLRTGGEELADKLRAGGVRVNARVFDGVTADFFSLGSTVPEARTAEDYAVNQVRIGFPPPLAPFVPGSLGSPPRPRRTR